MKDSFDEVIDLLIKAGLSEPEALILITELFEQEAMSFVFGDLLFGHQEQIIH